MKSNIMQSAGEQAFTQQDVDSVVTRYSKRYQEFGYSPETLGWFKGKQGIRFNSLTSQYDFHGKHVLDIGAGFGDLNKTLSSKVGSYKYTGVELVDEFCTEARSRYRGDHIQFIKANILDLDSDLKFDYAISSGIFNHKLHSGNNYQFIEDVIAKALSMTRDGLAFDFLSDKVDFFKYDYTFHSKPEKILEIAYKFSRNVVLKNDYMPFEFSLFIFKNDQFAADDTVFNYYKDKASSRYSLDG